MLKSGEKIIEELGIHGACLVHSHFCANGDQRASKKNALPKSQGQYLCPETELSSKVHEQ